MRKLSQIVDDNILNGAEEKRTSERLSKKDTNTTHIQTHSFELLDVEECV
eukprot:m.69846 g.69846  ORF g.69846 m.69846 type:complete len:50 (-) comp11647_c0_seq1:1785-1934(-)